MMNLKTFFRNSKILSVYNNINIENVLAEFAQWICGGYASVLNNCQKYVPIGRRLRQYKIPSGPPF